MPTLETLNPGAALRAKIDAILARHVQLATELDAARKTASEARAALILGAATPDDVATATGRVSSLEAALNGSAAQLDAARDALAKQQGEEALVLDRERYRETHAAAAAGLKTLAAFYGGFFKTGEGARVIELVKLQAELSELEAEQKRLKGQQNQGKPQLLKQMAAQAPE